MCVCVCVRVCVCVCTGFRAIALRLGLLGNNITLHISSRITTESNRSPKTKTIKTLQMPAVQESKPESPRRIWIARSA